MSSEDGCMHIPRVVFEISVSERMPISITFFLTGKDWFNLFNQCGKLLVTIAEEAST